MLPFKRTILHKFKLAGDVAAVFACCVVLLLTLCALKCNFLYRTIFLSVCHIVLLRISAPERI